MKRFWTNLCKRFVQCRKHQWEMLPASSKPDRTTKQARRSLFWNENHFFLGDLPQHLFAYAQVLIDQTGWSVGHPLSERNILIMRCREYLDEHKIPVAGIFDVVRCGLLYVTYVAFLEVHCAGMCAGGKYSHTSLPADIVLPLVLIGVPGQLAESSRFQR